MSNDEPTPHGEEFASLDKEITDSLEERTLYVAFGSALEGDPDSGISERLPTRTEIDVALYLSLYDMLNLKGVAQWRHEPGMYRVTLIDLEGDSPLTGRAFGTFMVSGEIYGEVRALVSSHLANKLSLS